MVNKLLVAGLGLCLAVPAAAEPQQSIGRAAPAQQHQPIRAILSPQVMAGNALRQPTNSELRQQIDDLSRQVQDLTAMVQALTGQISGMNTSLTQLSQREADRYRFLENTTYYGCLAAYNSWQWTRKDLGTPTTDTAMAVAKSSCHQLGMDTPGIELMVP